MSTEYRRIKNRRDTSAGWIEKNPVLLEGELGLETDTRKIKFGDGVNYWIDLPYSGVDSQEITDIVTSISYTKQEVDTIVNTVEGSIPTNTSDLNNDSGFITSADVPTKTSDLVNDSGFITSADVPTKTSDLTNDSGFITLNDVPAQQQADWTEANTTAGSYIKNKPNLATVATSGDYADLTNKPTIPTDTSDLTNSAGFITINDVPAQQQSNWTETNTTLGSYIQNKPNLATVATSGSYTDLTNTPTIPTDTSDLTNNAGFITINDVPAQQQADWTEADTSDPSYIQNKPSLATVATSGDYNDLTNTPTIPAAQVNSDWNAASGVAQILNKPTIPTVNDATVTFTQGGVTKGSVTLNQGTDATIALDAGGGTQVNADWNESDPTDPAYIENKPTLATVATSGDYTDLTNTPTLATVATTGDYDDLTNTPSIPAAQVNSDWNANSGVAQILNKPTIPTVPPMATELLTFTLSDLSTTSILVYVKPEPFYIKDVSGASNTLSITKNAKAAPSIEVFKSTDMENWTSMGTTSTTPITATIPANGKLYLKATASQWSLSNFNYNTITASGNFNVGGNIMSLLNGDNYVNVNLTGSNNLLAMFYNSTNLVDASKLIMPNNAIANSHQYMFYGCTSLVNAPALPATDIAVRCYSNMFGGCTSLTTAPTLPATALYRDCYASMFNGCTNLNKVITYGSTISYPYTPDDSWLNGVSVSGDFYRLGSYNSWSIPSGWTVHTSL